MMANGFTIGVDFGTSNSYLSQSPLQQLQVQQITFDSALKGFETAILYQEGQSPLVGSRALETYGTMTWEERKGCQLKALFKPELGKSPQVNLWARDYLVGLLHLNRRYNLDLLNRGERFIFGIPSLPILDSQRYSQALAEVAREAGFPEIELLEEPVGALLYHLAQNNLSTSAAQQGVLVVDFGGGTCDFALMQGLQVKKSWGNMLLGGRLFDDLFYQIFLEQDPGHEERVLSEDGEFFVHWYLCREAKEKFSQQMMVNRGQAFHYPFLGYGRIRDLTWEHVIERAKNYSPTQSLLEYFSHNGVDPKPLTSRGGVDLLKWFQEELDSGFPRGQELGHVILAGGSSLWPFVREMVEDLTHIPPEKIYCGDNPYAVVSKGLALYPALVYRNQRAKKNLLHQYPTFVKKNIKEDLLHKKFAQLGDELTVTFSSLLFLDWIKPLLEDFRAQGGKLHELEENIQKAIQDFLHENRSSMVKRFQEELAWISYRISQQVVEFFAKEGLYYPTAGALSLSSSPFILQDMDLPTKSLLYSLKTITTPMATYLGVEMGGFIALVLAASGPPGWITGGLLGFFGGYWGGKQADSYLMKVNLPASLTRKVIRPQRINRLLEKGKKEFQGRLQEYLSQEMEGIKEQFLQEMGPAIRQEVESLSLIASLKPSR